MYCLGKNLCRVSRVGISFHNSLRIKEVRSGPRPLCLDSLHDRFQSVSGHSDSHLSGLRGHSENGGAVSPAGGSISLFRTDDMRKSYTCFIEMSSMLRPNFFSLQIVWKNSLSKQGGAFRAGALSLRIRHLYSWLWFLMNLWLMAVSRKVEIRAARALIFIHVRPRPPWDISRNRINSLGFSRRSA